MCSVACGVLGYMRLIPTVKGLQLFRATFTGLKLIERPVEYCFVQHSTSQFLLIRWTEHSQNLPRKGRWQLEHRTRLWGGVGGEPISHEKSSEKENPAEILVSCHEK